MIDLTQWKGFYSLWMHDRNWSEKRVTEFLISRAKRWGIDNLDVIEIINARRNGLI